MTPPTTDQHADMAREAIGLLRSVKLSGEPWSDQCDNAVERGLAALAALRAQAAAADQLADAIRSECVRAGNVGVVGTGTLLSHVAAYAAAKETT